MTLCLIERVGGWHLQYTATEYSLDILNVVEIHVKAVFNMRAFKFSIFNCFAKSNVVLYFVKEVQFVIHKHHTIICIYQNLKRKYLVGIYKVAANRP